MHLHMTVSAVLPAWQELDMFAMGSHRLQTEQTAPSPQ
jgi:hypothetical protein